MRRGVKIKIQREKNSSKREEGGKTEQGITQDLKGGFVRRVEVRFFRKKLRRQQIGGGGVE